MSVESIGSILMDCYEKEQEMMSGSISHEHRCSGGVSSRDEWSKIELGGRVTSHIMLSDRWPRDHALEVIAEAFEGVPDLPR